MDILVENLSFSVDGREILHDISLNMTDGGLIGVIGPNGAGKTTLLRCISGYYAPSRGRVLVGGQDVRSMESRERARLMALVPQYYLFEYNFTVEETVLMGRNPHKKLLERDTQADRDIVDACIRRAGIEHLAKRSVLTLSGGEWQRMVIARALAQQSKLILLDEPLSNLDIRHQVAILALVRELTCEGLTAVTIMHDLTLTYNYCDEVAILKGGRCVQHGAPKEIMTVPNLQEVYDTRVHITRNGADTYIMPAMLE